MSNKRGVVLLPRRATLTVAIPGLHIDHFVGGRIAIFRLYRRALLMKMPQAFDGHPVRMTGISIERNPIMLQPVYFMSVTAQELIP